MIFLTKLNGLILEQNSFITFFRPMKLQYLSVSCNGGFC